MLAAKSVAKGPIYFVFCMYDGMHVCVQGGMHMIAYVCALLRAGTGGPGLTSPAFLSLSSLFLS